MGKIKDALDHICHRMDEIRDLNRCQLVELQKISDAQRKSKDEADEMIQVLVALNNMLCDFGEMLEEQQTEGQDAQLLRVMPAENAGKEALFVVTGDELANLLEACSGATLRMKKKEADKK